MKEWGGWRGGRERRCKSRKSRWVNVQAVTLDGKTTCSSWMLRVLSSNIFIDMNSSFDSGLITKEPTLMCYLEICDYSLWFILRHCDRSSNYLSCFWRKKSAEMRFAKLKSWRHLKVYILLILIVRQLHAWHRGAPAYSHELWETPSLGL